MANDQLPTNKLQRKLTVFLQAPPGDGIRSAREHFLEYVKPVLVSAAIDWEVVEGRREGEIRAGLAERIRRKRKKAGELEDKPDHEPKADLRTLLEVNRQKTGVEEWDGVGGDLVIGRHAWKEYVRGMHEGWLGPMDPPKQESPDASQENHLALGERAAEALRKKNEAEKEKAGIHATPEPEMMSTPEADPLGTKVPEPSSDEASPISSDKNTEKEQQEETKPPPKPLVPPAHNTPLSYPSSQLSLNAPIEFSPSAPVAFPYLPGFLNTPIRMYRFITRRYVTDDIGRQTAAAVMATHRSFHNGSDPSVAMSSSSPEPSGDHTQFVAQKTRWEQQDILKHEELEWHKSVRKRNPDSSREYEWTDPMVLDERIASRMRQFELNGEDEDRADRIGRGAKGIPGRAENSKSDYED